MGSSVANEAAHDNYISLKLGALNTVPEVVSRFFKRQMPQNERSADPSSVIGRIVVFPFFTQSEDAPLQMQDDDAYRLVHDRYSDQLVLGFVTPIFRVFGRNFKHMWRNHYSTGPLTRNHTKRICGSIFA